MNNKDLEREKEDPFFTLSTIIRRNPLLNRLLSGESKSIYKLTIKFNDDGILIVASRLSPDDGTPEVAFEQPYDTVSLLQALRKLESGGGHWKVDKYLVGALPKRQPTLAKVEDS